MSDPAQRAIMGEFMDRLERQRREDRKERKERFAEELKEKKRARRPTYLRWGVVLFSMCIGLFFGLKTYNRADKFLDMLPTAPHFTYVNDVKGWTDEAAIMIVPIQGQISGHPLERSESQGLGALFGGSANAVLSMKRTLQEAGAIKGLAELILFVESPGGGVTASDEIYSMIRVWREKHPKVAVSAYFYGMAASGGYYVAMAADTIAAQPTSMVGSISVVMQIPNIAELAEKFGVKMNIIKTGKAKDIGNMFRAMTADEQARLQRLADQMHQRFVQVVSEGRPKLPREAIEKLADGDIHLAHEALALGLIDATSRTFDEFMAKRANSVMERVKAKKVHVLYPGNRGGRHEEMLTPKE